MKSIPEHQTHLWFLQPGHMVPLGLVPKAMEVLSKKEELDRFSVSAEELNLYVVENDKYEVFASKDDAIKALGEDRELDGKMERMDNILTEDEGAVWSDSAKLKISNIIAKAEKLMDLLDEKEEDSEFTKVNTNGPVTDQDHLEDEIGVGDTSPKGDEENVMMPEYMDMGVKQLRAERINKIKKSTSRLARWIEDKKREEIRVIMDEEAAVKELESLREQARNDRLN
jgi:hypothetical protein